MANIKISIHYSDYITKIAQIVVSKHQQYDNGYVYVIRESFYDGKQCKDDYNKQLEKWHKNDKKGKKPIERKVSLIEGDKFPKTIAFTNIDSVNSYLFQRLWYIADIENETSESFSMSVNFGDIELNYTDDDINCCDKDTFKDLLNHNLSMFDGVINYIDHIA